MHLGNDRLSVTWKFNKKTWMTTVLFDNWLCGFNKKMKSQKRKVVLLLDNAPSHLHRALCIACSNQTQTAHASLNADTGVSRVYASPTPPSVYTFALATHRTFSRTAGQSQAYYYQSKVRVGGI